MRKFVENVLEWKTAAALMFSASIFLCAIIMLFMGETSIPISIIASLAIVSGVGMFLQHLAFTDRIIKKMRYTMRIIVFAIPFLALLAANAWFFQWFYVGNMSYWLAFAAIYLIVFIGGTVSFEIYYRTMGRKYDGLLGQYRKQKEAEKA